MAGNFDDAIELLNQLIVVYPTFSPSLVEKMKVQLCLQDWDQADETANRILSGDPKILRVLDSKFCKQHAGKAIMKMLVYNFGNFMQN